MQVTVKGIHLDVGEALTTHVENTLGALAEKYFNGRAIDGTVTFTKEKSHRYSVLVALRIARGDILEATFDAEEIYPAFEGAAEKLGTRLRRYKDKLRDHHRKEDAAELHTAAYTTFNVGDEAEGGDEPAVVAEMETQIQTLAVADAVMQLELRDLPFLMFKNPAHGGYNVVYRRRDGNIGWIDPEGRTGGKTAARAAG
jgi:ribosomal subunit interface protein